MSYALRFVDVDAFARENKLAIRTHLAVEPGAGLVICVLDEIFFAEIIDVNPADDTDTKHDYYVTIKCNRMEELRKAFTYKVEARA